MNRLALLVLLCSISATLQQDAFWFSPHSWLSYLTGYPAVHQAPRQIYEPLVSVNPRNRFSQQRDAAELVKLIGELREESKKKKTQEKQPAAVVEGRIKTGAFSKDNKEEKKENRGFGGLKWLGLNALLNANVDSSSTSTTYSTSISTVTLSTVVSCYTRTLFLSTTPCRRRKRKLLPGLLVGDENSDYPISPSQPESIEASLELEAEKQRQAKMVDGIDTSKFLIESSIKEHGEDAAAPQGTVSIESSLAHPRNKRFFGFRDSGEFFEETVFVSTATLTSFSVYTYTSTSTIFRLAAASIMSCLPACFTLC